MNRAYHVASTPGEVREGLQKPRTDVDDYNNNYLQQQPIHYAGSKQKTGQQTDVITTNISTGID